MPNPPPKSRPEPQGEERPANPQPESPVYGGQWGSSGKQNEEARPDPGLVQPSTTPAKPH
jgi:hypothetical protein